MSRILVIFICMLAACQSTTKNFGETFQVDHPMTVDAVLQDAKKKDLSNVQVEGTIAKSCLSEGCWFTILDNNSVAVLFNVQDKKFRIPVNSPGKKVIALIDAKRDSTGKPELTVRGLRFP
jgi:hypothetical protein